MRDDTLRSCEVSSPARALVTAAGCAGPGYFTDGSSVSVGSFNHGALRRGARLPAQGEGYVIPPLWQKRARQLRHRRARRRRRACRARRVRREYPGALLGVGDMSLQGRRRQRPAPLARERPRPRSHLLRRRRAQPPGGAGRLDAALSVLRSARARAGAAGARRRLRAVLDALLRRASATGRWCARCSRSRASRFSTCSSTRACASGCSRTRAEQGEDPSLLERAEAILHQPGDSAPHDDHLHVRIFCAEDDRALRLQRLGAGALVEEALQVHGADGAAHRRRRARRRAGAAHRHRSLAQRSIAKR